MGKSAKREKLRGGGGWGEAKKRVGEGKKTSRREDLLKKRAGMDVIVFQDGGPF